MLNKHIDVFLLLFSLISVVNCEYKYSLIFDFEVDSNKKITCSVKPDDRVVLVKGEKIEIMANNVMSQVIYMWCKDQNRNIQVDRCSYDVEAKQCSAVVDDVKPSKGIWYCEYLLKRDETSINSTLVKHGTEYNYARCTLLVDIKGSLWFTGLDPKRRSITTNQYQTYYEYKFKRGEKLNISCEQEGSDPKNFKLRGGLANETYIGSRLERQGTLDLISKQLTCSFAGKDRSNQTDIMLSLKQDSSRDPLWFTGLDYSRVTTTTIDGSTNYTYKYKLHEDLKVGCDAEENHTANDIFEISFQFIASVNSTRITPISSPSLFEVSSANSTLNSSSLLCVLKKYTQMVYTVNLDFVLDLSDTTDAQEHKTGPATDPKFNWKVVLIAVPVVILCGIALSVVLIRRRQIKMTFQELTPKYFTLKEEHTRTRTPPPENAYLAIKEPNNAGESLYSYADLNRRRLDFGLEETYAEPGYTKTEFYSPPQTGSKMSEELNYTNEFKQGYVNSQK